MGKFGTHKLPEFILKQLGTIPVNEEDVDVVDPKQSYADVDMMKDMGMVPKTSANTEAKIIDILGQADIEEIQAAGYKERKVDPGEIWALVKTVEGDEAILRFDFDEDTFSSDDNYPEYGYGELTAHRNDWEYMIPADMYNPRNGEPAIEDYYPHQVEAKPLSEKDWMHSSNKKAHMKPTQYQREVKYKDPENYYSKAANHIVKLWSEGSKKPIEFIAYRAKFTITDPTTQVDPKTGNITSDEGEVIPFDEISGIRIRKYLTNHTPPETEDYKKMVQKFNMEKPDHRVHYRNTEIGGAGYQKDESHKVFESFQDFEQQEEVNEEDMLIEPTEMAQPCEGCSDQPEALSETAKSAIKNMCNEVLIKEAHVYETSEDPNQSYETFLKECSNYLAECLIRASQNLKV